MGHHTYGFSPIIRWSFLCIYVVLSLMVMGRYLVTSNLGDTWRAATLEQMVYGSAERPYVYRRLIPLMSSAVLSVTPMATREKIGEIVSEYTTQLDIIKVMAGQKRGLRFALEKTQSFYLRGVAALIVFGFLWLFIIAQRRLTEELFPNIGAMALFAPLITLIIIPALLTPTAYIYDIPALALATCCYLSLYKRQWKWYFFWFILACLNKETASFTIIFFALWFWPRMERRQFLTLMGAQILIFTIIRFAIFWQFRHNPGIFLATSYLIQQVAILVGGYGYKALIGMFVMVFLLVHRWQEKPPFAQYGMVLLMLMYAAYFLFGRPMEYRVFLDVLPLVGILITHTMIECTGLSRIRWFSYSKDFMPASQPAMNDTHAHTGN